MPSNHDLSDHTVVIPTYNRPELLERLISYILKSNSSTSVFILDGSNDEIARRNGSMARYFGENVKHVAYNQEIPLIDRIYFGLLEVRTSTVSLCADDDVIFLDGLGKCRDFLIKSPEYSLSHGIYVNFHEEFEDINLTIEYSGDGILATDPGARIFDFLNQYESMFYGVSRTQDLREIYSSMSRLSTIHYQEMFQSCAMLIKGKVNRLPVFYAGRRSGNPAEPGRTKWQTFYWFAENPIEVLQEYVLYREELRSFYAKHCSSKNQDLMGFGKALDLGHSVYFSRGCPSEYFRSILDKDWPVGNKREKSDILQIINERNKIKKVSAYILLFNYVLHINSSLERYIQKSESQILIKYLNELNQKMRNKGFKRECRLPEQLRWLANTTEFRDMYKELCVFMG